jgi:tetratricopeptide (TPR) repeat protein
MQVFLFLMLEGTNVNEAPTVPEKNRGRTGKKDLQICGAGRKSRKGPTLIVGWKPYVKSRFMKKHLPLLAILFLLSTPAFADDATSIFNSGVAKFNKGDMDGAIADFTTYIGLQPDDESSYLYRGEAKMANLDSDGAITDFTKAIELKPDDAVAYCDRGSAKKEGVVDLDGAIADLNKAIQLKPDYADAYYLRGLTESMKRAFSGGSHDAAIADFSKTIELKPDDVDAYKNRADEKRDAGDYTGAIADYSKVLELKPGEMTACYERANAERLKGDLDGAIADFTKLIEFEIANANSDKTNTDKTILDTTIDAVDSIILKSDYPRSYLGRGLAKMAKNDVDGAIVDYSEAITLNTNDEVAYLDRGKAEKVKGDLDDAIADYSEAIAFETNNVNAFNDRGIAKQAKGDLDGAIADYSKVLELKPEYVDAYGSRGLAKEAEGDLDGALADYSKAIELNPKYIWGYHGRGCLRYDSQDYTNAMADFRKAVELDSTYDYAHFRIWLIRTRLGETNDATTELQTYLDGRTTGKPDDWPSKVGHYLTDKLAEPDFLAAANNADPQTEAGQLCEAYYYAGSKHLFARDNATATNYFNKSIATDKKDYTEYSSALAELRFLKSASPEQINPEITTPPTNSTSMDTNTNPSDTMSSLFSDPVIARGNGFEIKQSELDEVLGGIKSVAAARGQSLSPEQMTEKKGLILNRLIQIQVLLQNATDADRAEGQSNADLQLSNLQAAAVSPAVLGMTEDEFRTKVIQQQTSAAVWTREMGTVTDEKLKQAYMDNLVKNAGVEILGADLKAASAAAAALSPSATP